MADPCMYDYHRMMEVTNSESEVSVDDDDRSYLWMFVAPSPESEHSDDDDDDAPIFVFLGGDLPVQLKARCNWREELGIPPYVPVREYFSGCSTQYFSESDKPLRKKRSPMPRERLMKIRRNLFDQGPLLQQNDDIDMLSDSDTVL